MTLVHGDDFVSVGSRHATRQFRSRLEARFEIKTQVIGAEKSEGGACASSGSDRSQDQSVQEGRVLNRVVRWAPQGWEVEPDQLHVDLIVKELGLLDAKPVSTPGETENRVDEADNNKLLSAGRATKF